MRRMIQNKMYRNIPSCVKCHNFLIADRDKDVFGNWRGICLECKRNHDPEFDPQDPGICTNFYQYSDYSLVY